MKMSHTVQFLGYSLKGVILLQFNEGLEMTCLMMMMNQLKRSNQSKSLTHQRRRKQFYCRP